MLLGGILFTALAVGFGICLSADAFASLHWLWILPVSFLTCVLLLAGLAFGFLWWMCKRVRTDIPQETDSSFYRKMTNLYIRAIMTFARLRVTKHGLDQLPESGRFLLVCNHCHDSDPAILLDTFPKSQLAFVSKRENSEMFLVGKLMHKLMCPLMNRENDREALKTILKCIQMLKDDLVSVAVFPEGYIHDDRLLHPFRHGVFKIAQKAKVPIVVCTLKDTRYVFDNFFHMKPSKVELNLLTVIPVEEVLTKSTVQLGQEIYAMMAEDLGPERVYHGKDEE